MEAIMKRKIYLASPYTHKDLGVREQRAIQVAKVAGKLIQKGNNVFCPIAHSHYIAKYSEVDAASAAGDNYEHNPVHLMWMRVDIAMLEDCTHLYVLMLDGWKESKGVLEELDIARHLGLEVVYLDEQGDVVSIEDPFYSGGG